MTQLADEQRVSPSFSDRCKRVFLGKPMINDQLQHERLSNPVALGVLSPDAISSTAYGSEQVMIELLPAAGMAAFALLLPVTGVILLILVLVAASYRQVVTGLHPRRRLLRGRPGELRTQGRPDRRGIAADRLRRHRRGAVRGRNGRGGVGDTCSRSLQPGNHRRHCSADVLCQPARIARSRAAVCAADLFIRRHGLVDDRRRDHS